MSAIHRIILVGNGFDLAHGLATRYENFIDWYWEQWNIRLSSSGDKKETDGLCSFTLKESVKLASWRWIPWCYKLPEKDMEHLKYGMVDIARSDTSLCDFQQHSVFFQKICQSIESKGWVDIENEYYQALNHEYFECPEKLNKEFEIVKSKLVKYLTLVQSSNIDESIVKPVLREKYWPLSASTRLPSVPALNWSTSSVRGISESPTGPIFPLANSSVGTKEQKTSRP